MLQPEKRVLWHPRKKNRFVVGENSQIILYEWASEYPEIRHVTSKHDLQSMKCFAWSPDPAFEDLLAVGFNSGKVDLIRLEASKQSQRKNVLSSGPSVALPVRNTRTCNALAFNNMDPNYLAVGLDKFRGDSSLIIWDISTLLPSVRLPSIGPLDVLAVNNLSVPHSRPQPPIPRVENHGRIDSRIVQQHVPTETVSSLTFLPSSMHLLLANIFNRYLRLFDLRAPSIPAMNVVTKLCGIAADPLDPHRIASFGDSAVTIWDVRKIMQPLLIFSERDALADGAWTKPGASSYSNIEFSSTRRGTLATMEKDSTYVRFWDLAESRVGALNGSAVGGGGSSDGETNKSSRDSNRASRKSWAAIPWPSGGEKEKQQHISKEKDLPSSLELLSQQNIVLADTRRTKYFPRPLASFALVPNANSNAPHSITSDSIVVNADGDLELYAIHDTPKQIVWSAKGDLAFGAGLGLKLLEGYYEGENNEDEGDYVPEIGMDQRRRSMSNRYRDGSSRGSGGSRGRASERDRNSRSPPHQRPTSSTRTRGLPDFAGTDPYTTHTISSLPVIPSTPDTPPTTVKSSTLFGFGDDADLPSLPTPPTSSAATTITSPGGLAATRQKNFGQSPARVKKYSQLVETSKERKAEKLGQRRSLSRTDTLPADDLDDNNNEYNVDFRRSRSLNKSSRPSYVPKSQSRDAREKGRFKATGVASLVQEDISMIMRKRVKAGYGLSQLQHNVLVTQNREPAKGAGHALPEIWAWLHHSQETLCLPTPHLHGYDFSFQGLLGIWEAFAPVPIPHQPEVFVDETTMTMQRSLLLETGPQSLHMHTHSHSATTASSTASSGMSLIGRRSRSPVNELQSNWSAALAVLIARRGTDKTTWKPTVSTSKLLQRRIALHLVGWSLRDDELAAAIKRWQKEGQFARAACWLVFTKQYSKAVELLMRSDDETHQMMSGTIAALGPLMSASGSARGLELRELYGRLIIKLNDPYFRMLLTHLSTNEWSEVLDEEVVPFRERLAIAFQFLDDRTLTSYLYRMIEQACEHGSIEGLMVTGLTPPGMRIIQSYLDHTGDVQTAAILSSYVCPHRFKYKRAERWLEAYRDLLDGFKLHYLRVGFDIERGQILHEATQGGEFNTVEEWAPRQILISCHYCHKQVNTPGPTDLLQNDQQTHNGRPTQCSNCGRELPRCSVCLMTLSIISDATREVALGYTHNRDTFDDAIVICQTCRHGGHAAHILEWFLGEDGRRTHHICPVADCTCRCADEF